MTNYENLSKRTTIGDAAVDGLLAGLVAGAGMIVYLTGVGLALYTTWSTLLTRFVPEGAALPLTGILTLLAMAGVYGALFGVLTWLTPRPWRRRLNGWPMGLLYVAFLLLLAETIFLPRLALPVQQVPFLHLLLGHAIYGFILGRLINLTGAFNH
ncbi:MAG: hypothetical protein U0350_06430 [Caldilineaceae bacterium]